MLIYGINPVCEALQSNRCHVNELWVAHGRSFKGLSKILSIAESNHVPVTMTERASLDSRTRNAPHQGVVGLLDRFDYATVEEMLDAGVGAPLMLVLDGIQDPRNLGALIRSADSCGVWGVIIPKNRAAGITPATAKSSAGTIFHLPLARVTNISETLRNLKDRGIWVVGATAESTTKLYDQDLTIPVAVVIGGEGSGLRPLVKKRCDLLVSIPMRGTVTSLNASVAGAVLLYEILRQREKALHLPEHPNTF
jgi:23S rRNA (guanosine2251-2'-O)-methyltransferase